MGTKGNRRHLKRYNLPAFFPIARKEHVFLMKPRAGPHPKEYCFPLGFIIRDYLKLASTFREAKFILNSKKVSVDGVIRTDFKFPIGLMDVIEIADINKSYRVLPSKIHSLMLSEITKEEAKFKLCRIDNISTQRHGHLQLNLHDGRNVKIIVDDASKKPNIPYKTMGTLKLSIPDQQILEYYPFAEHNQAIVFQGKNQGIAGTVLSFSKHFGHRASTATLKTDAGENISTAYEFTFIIGDTKPCIDLPTEEKKIEA
jgi:small subunit ribosomal protein S4e